MIRFNYLTDFDESELHNIGLSLYDFRLDKIIQWEIHV